MGKHSRNPPPLLEPLRPVDYIKHPVVVTGIPDITRPRDIYSFLSLGYISNDPHTSISSQKQRAVPGSDWNNHNSHVTQISAGNLPTSSYPDWEKNNPSSYILFDTLNTHSKLPAIHPEGNIIEENNDTIDSAEKEGSENENANEIIDVTHTPRKSLINEEDHKINITQTYIFAPPGRLDETCKYNKNIILPKIKPKKTFSGELLSKDQETNANLTVANAFSPTKQKQVQFNPNSTEISPKPAAEMNTNNNFLFGARPECLFLNNRLGDRNPLLRTHKESPTLSVPKASPGLQDLKDYEEYPEAYWKLRDSTITQPEDLEADMIDRDLYRLRQISTLKLNSIEKTFQVHQDPFRRWRWKAGEPVFSPRQQHRPVIRSYRDKKIKDIPIYPQALSKPKFKLNFSPTKQPALEFNDVLISKNPQNQRMQKNDISKQDNDYHVSKIDSPFEDAPEFPPLDTPRDSLRGGTPREVVAASLESFHRMDEKLAEGDQFGKIPIQKMHQLKGKQNKLPVKTAFVKVDLEPLETYKNEHRNSSTKPICKNNSKGVGHSHKLESFRERYEEQTGSKVNTERSDKGNNNGDNLAANTAVSITVTLNEQRNDDNDTDDANNSGSKKVPVAVSTLLLQPDLSRLSLCPPGDVINNWDAETGTLTSAAAMMNRPGLTSPVVSDISGATKEKRKNNHNTPVKPMKLEVFSERIGGGVGVGGGNHGDGVGDSNSYIKIPTGRISYHRAMPTYKLDLVNYPPSNARQSCLRSSSAGISDGRHTHFTTATPTNNPLTPRSRARGASGEQSPDKNIPPKSSDTNISIRFGQQGQVIVSSSREGRRSR